MVGELIEIIQRGQELATGVGDVRAVLTLYSWGGTALGQFKKFFGTQQEENIKAISEKAQEYLKDVPDDQKTVPSASIAEPLIEAAMQENRSELQDLWAALLASAMLEKGRKVRYEFVEILKKLNPQDAVAFRILATLPSVTWSNPTTDPNQAYVNQQLAKAGLSQDEWLVSINNLNQLGCVIPSNPSTKTYFTAGASLDYPVHSPLGRMLGAVLKI